MAFNYIERADALADLAQQKFSSIITPEQTGSVVLNTFPTVQMSKGTASMPVLSALPQAGWVKDIGNDAEGIKPTSKVKWENKDLTAAELAVIVPVHENTLADSDFDVFAQIAPLISQQFGAALDKAVLFGTNKPSVWTDKSLVEGAVAAQNTVARATGTPLFDSMNETFAKVEEDGWDVNTVFTGRFMRSQLRGVRDTTGALMYLDSVRDDGRTSALFGEDLRFVAPGVWNKTAAELLVGDRSSVVIGIREDVNVKVLTESSLTTDTGQFNLAERDFIAFRFKFRVAYALAYSTAGVEDASHVFPWAVMTPQG